MVQWGRTDGGAFAVVVAVALAVVLGCGNVGDPFGDEITAELTLQLTNPADGAVGVSINTIITLSFPVALDARTVQADNIVLNDATGRAVELVLVYDGTTRVVTARPRVALQGTMLYQLVVQGLKSSTGVAFRSKTLTFTTGTGDPGGAPEVVGVSPLPAQAQLPTSAKVTVNFSEAMDRATVEGAFSISGGVPGSFSWSNGDKTMTFTPGLPLAYDATYSVTVLNSARDVAGTPLRAGTSWWFTTRTSALFQVTSTVPFQGATTAPADVSLRFTFSEPVDRSTVLTNFAISPGAAPQASEFTFQQNDQVIVYDPPANFSAGQTVRATFAISLTSVYGEHLPLAFTLQFSIETAAPRVVSTVPTNGATQVPANQAIRFTFSEPLDPAATNINAANFQVIQGGPIPGALTMENNNRTIVFTPSTAYTTGPVPVTVTAAGALADLAGTAMGTDVVISFSIDDLPPGILSSTPANGALQVIPDASPTFTVIFTEPVAQAATQASFSLSPASAMGGVFAWASSTRMQYTTTTPLLGSTNYTVSLNIVDLAGNTSPASVVFRTDDVRPQVNLVVPNPGAAGVARNANITVNFSERMRLASVVQAFSYQTGANPPLHVTDGVATWNHPTYPTQLIFNPTVDFLPSAAYTVTVTSGAVDVGGNQMLVSYTSTFTTTL